MEQMRFLGRRNGSGDEAMEDKEQTFCLVFRAMGKNLETKIQYRLYKSTWSSVDIAYYKTRPEIWNYDGTHVSSSPMTTSLISQCELGDIKERKLKW